MKWNERFSLPQLQALLDHETEAVLHSDPRIAPWGYYLETENGWGYFCWFQDPQARLAYVVQVEILHAATSLREQADYEVRYQRLAEFASQMESGQLSSEVFCQALNAEVQEFRLRWWGDFRELCQGEGIFAQELRQAFTKRTDDLDPSQADDFVAFLEHYGL